MRTEEEQQELEITVEDGWVDRGSPAASGCVTNTATPSGRSIPPEGVLAVEDAEVHRKGGGCEAQLRKGSEGSGGRAGPTRRPRFSHGFWWMCVVVAFLRWRR